MTFENNAEIEENFSLKSTFVSKVVLKEIDVGFIEYCFNFIHAVNSPQ